jgi:hypothetical protein
MIFDKASDGKRGARKPVSSGHFVVEPTGALFPSGWSVSVLCRT